MTAEMELTCDEGVAAAYKSPAQKARIISETWLSRNGYCLACSKDSLRRSPANTKCTDFSCDSCGQAYELKTFNRRPSGSLVDGAYSALISRILEGSAPTLFLLQRSTSWEVESFTAIHSVFLTPSVVEKRKPLNPSAVRAGWVGCNIRLDRIGPDGEIDLIKNGHPRPKHEVRSRFRQFVALSVIPPAERGWTTLTLTAIRGLAKAHVELADLYEKEGIFAAAYPRNNNVRPKLRQQLQVLRDLGLIRFEGSGNYTLCR